MKREDMMYTSCYCEENIYHLCATDKDFSAVFVSNPNKSVPFWNQRSSKDVVVWDYHVIAVKRGLVYDLDTKLAFPTTWKDYSTNSLRIDNTLPTQFQRYYRIVPGDVYLQNLSSDRSHMIKDGKYQATPPVWPPIKMMPDNNLSLFIEMNFNLLGTVMTEAEFIEWMK
jgi:protein N-terminal glutamine amidohydrolase